MPFTGKWPRGSASSHRPYARSATNAPALYRGNNFVRGHGGRLRGNGGRGRGGHGEHVEPDGHGGHTPPLFTNIYSEALRSICGSRLVYIIKY